MCILKTVLFLILLLLCLNSKAQKRPIETSISVYLTGDAAMEFIGPSIAISQEIPLINDNIALVPYAQYFYATYDTPEDSFTSYIVGAMLQINKFSDKRNGFYYAIGPAFQYRRLYYFGDEEVEYNILPTFRIGYRFLAKKIKLHAEITTPAFDAKGPGFELFTLPSIGVRVGF